LILLFANMLSIKKLKSNSRLDFNNLLRLTAAHSSCGFLTASESIIVSTGIRTLFVNFQNKLQYALYCSMKIKHPSDTIKPNIMIILAWLCRLNRPEPPGNCSMSCSDSCIHTVVVFTTQRGDSYHPNDSAQ